MGPEETGPEGRPGVGTETEEPRWWESAEGHRFDLEVLQLGVRRDILKFIGEDVRSAEEVAEEFGIDERQATFHLAMLERALVAEAAGGGFRSTSTGLLYIKNVETAYPGKF